MAATVPRKRATGWSGPGCASLARGRSSRRLRRFGAPLKAWRAAVRCVRCCGGGSSTSGSEARESQRGRGRPPSSDLAEPKLPTEPSRARRFLSENKSSSPCVVSSVILSRHETCRLSYGRVGSVEAMCHRVDAVAATTSRCVAAQLHAIDATPLRKKDTARAPVVQKTGSASPYQNP